MIPGIVAGRAVLVSIPWTPAHLAVQPRVWMDWDSSVTNASGNASAWSNSKGSLGGQYEQATAGSRPAILAAEIGGKRALSFSSDYMSASSGMLSMMTNVSAAWMFAVYKKRGAGTGNNTLFCTTTNSGGGRFNATVGNASSARPTLNVRRLDADSAAMMSSPTGGTGVWLIRYDEMNYATGAAEMFLDGTSAVSNGSLTSAGSTSNTASSHASTIGAFANTAGTNPADVDVACIIVGAGSYPSSTEREKMEGWAAWGLGLEGNLPIGHPYKSAPPTV